MSVRDLDLQQLVAPIGTAAFFRDSWERQSLEVSRGDTGYYAGLFSAADIDQVIAFTRPWFVDPGAFEPGPPRAATFVQGWLAGPPRSEDAIYPGIAEIHRVFAQGKTVIIRAMQHRWPSVAALCRSLEAVFYSPVHANLYWTPSGAQGFDAHFDTHEVFVLQLEGAKTWRLYGSGRTLPLVEERLSVPKDQLGTPREVHLRAGDLLYLPRGHVHEAFTSEFASLHLTVGINVHRWADLLHEALADVTGRDERLRESLPPGTLNGQELTTALRDRFRQILEVLTEGAHAETALRRLGDRFFGQLQVLPDDRSVAFGEGDPVTLDTVLRRRPGTICRVVRDGEWVVIQFPGGQVGGPSRIASALDFVASADRFPVRALPDDLGAESKLVLARRLLREKLLEIMTRPDACDP